ncbi:hypothetical protein H5410_033801 [Solanum commersonii]|uniref:Uncharacterized protein n=1 Tax=Solanum commersonii TaxID=4109 RepID=A0A9J5YRM6_SOLCO|nr:hypothetical protein H5410_033801 [Solanum commersonii]
MMYTNKIQYQIFNMGHIDIDVKCRQRYATIPWQYGRSKNADDTISASEVTGIVASKIDGLT